MKRFKDLLLSLFIFSSIVIVVFIIISFFNTKRTIVISDTEDNINRLVSLKERVSLLNESECKDMINEYISYMDKSSFNGKTKLSDLNDNLFYPILTYYNSSKEKCGFTDNELKEYHVPEYLITQLSLTENLMSKYYYSYELNLKDNIRLLTEADTDSITYSSIRFNQLQILDAFVSLASKEDTHE